jgi:hypothetical protein
LFNHEQEVSAAGADNFNGLFATITPAFAQSYSMARYKVSGGGGTSANGQYSMTGTIGQHDVGTAMSGGSYSLTGGFWSLISACKRPARRC